MEPRSLFQPTGRKKGKKKILGRFVYCRFSLPVYIRGIYGCARHTRERKKKFRSYIRNFMYLLLFPQIFAGARLARWGYSRPLSELAIASEPSLSLPSLLLSLPLPPPLLLEPSVSEGDGLVLPPSVLLCSLSSPPPLSPLPPSSCPPPPSSCTSSKTQCLPVLTTHQHRASVEHGATAAGETKQNKTCGIQQHSGAFTYKAYSLHVGRRDEIPGARNSGMLTMVGSSHLAQRNAAGVYG